MMIGSEDVRISILGPIEATRASHPVDLGSPKQRAVLALLALRTGQIVDRDALLTGVWGDDVDTARARSLHTYVSNLRSALGEVVVRQQGGYRLALEPGAVDGHHFERAVADAHDTVGADPAGTGRRLREALSWWRGRPLADLDGTPGLDADIRRLEQLRLDAVELRVDADLHAGRHETLVPELAALADEHPLRERFRAQHMLALYRSGRPAEALRAYRTTARVLGDELGVEPSPELQRLEIAILGHDETVLAGPRQPTTQRMTVMCAEVDLPADAWDRDPQAVGEALVVHDRIVSASVERHGGHVVNRSSTGTTATFASVTSAIAAAGDAQRELGDVAWSTIDTLAVRIGIDTGEATVAGSAVSGVPLTRASRLCTVAHGGQVLMSAATAADVTGEAAGGAQLRLLGEHHLDGFPVPERVTQLVYDGCPLEFPPLRGDPGPVDDVDEPPSVPGYELREPVRRVAVGVLWRAYQPSVGREVAVLIVGPGRSDHPDFARWFEAEARTVARLAHPHIVPLIDFWRDTRGAYLVTQFIDGGSLHDSLPVDVAVARRVLRQIGAALDHAHDHDVVHGNLTTSSVLLDRAGNAYLADVGIAGRLLGGPHERTGTTPDADVLAFGSIARTLLSDRGVDPEVTSVLARANAAGPGDRFGTATELVAALDRALGEREVVVSSPARNPFKGLRAFDEADHVDFFGRRAVVDRLVAAVADAPFVVVVGPSGSGKSSVVRAGLLPALAAGAIDGSQHWHRIVLLPGTQPTDSLTRALELAPDEARVVVVIDQFEELYTLVESDEREQFVEVLLASCDEAAGGVRVIVTVRADYFDRPLGDPRIGQLASRAVVSVTPPDRDELLEMITAPVEAVGLRFEPGLPHRIVDDVVARAGGLPLLQYTLTEIAENRRGELLTTDDYVRVGGVAGSIAARAEAVFGEFPPPAQDAARVILLRLVTVDDTGADEARRLVRRSELESLGIARAELDRVLDAFVRDRLLSADRDPVTHGPTVEVAHEALLWAWPRLHTWIDEEREALVIGRKFRLAVADWEASGRSADYLLSAGRLAAFDEWADSASMTEAERAFHHSSIRAEDARRRTRRRRRRATVGSLIAAAVVATALAGLATVSAQRARTSAAAAAAERDRAEQQAGIARARELTAAAVSTLGTDPGLARLLILASLDAADPSPEAVSTLRRAVQADVVTARHPWPSEIDHMVAVALSPDASLVAFGGPTRRDLDIDRLEVRDTATWSLLWSNETYGHGIDGLYFTPDSQRLVFGMSAFLDGEFPTAVEVRDAATGELFAAHPVGECGPTIAAVTDRHALVQVRPAVGGSCEFDGGVVTTASLELMDLDTGSTDVVEGEALDVWRPTLSGDGRSVAFVVDDADPRSVVVDIATGARRLELDPATIDAADGFGRLLSPDGTLLLVGDRPMVVLDVASGREVSRFEGHGSSAHSAVFAADGRSVWSVGSDGNLFQWDPTDGSVVTDVPGNSGSGWVRASADGSTVLVDDLNSRSMSLVVAGSRSELWSVRVCEGSGEILDGTVTRVGAVVAVIAACAGDLVTAVVDPLTQSMIGTTAGGASPPIAASPDGRLVVRQETDDGEILPLRVRDARSGSVVSDLAEPGDRPARHITWSPDGRLVAAALGPRLVVVWDSSTSEVVGRVEACRRNVSDLVFVPDSSDLVVGCFEEPMALVSGPNWSIASRPDVDVGHLPKFVGFTPDGTTVLVLNAGTGSSTMHWVDPSSWSVVETKVDVHAGAATGWATSPSGAWAATAASDGFVKVWDVGARRQVDEMWAGREGARGVAFLDERTIVYGVGDRLVAATLEIDELVAIARSSLTRGFTVGECERYGFGEDCPTLDQFVEGVVRAPGRT